MGQTLENLIFCMISTNLKKTGDGGAGCFILLQNFRSKFLKN